MEKSQINAQAQAEQEDGEVGFINHLIILIRYKKPIVWAALGSALISAIVSVMLPSVYASTVTLLPPQQAQSSASMLLSQLGGLAGMASAAGLKNPADIYVAMLKSRTIADSVIDRFSLQGHYDLQSREKTRIRLANNTTIIAEKDGLITVTVEDQSQKIVASLDNSYVDELVKLNKTLAVTEAGQRRLFFEQELERSKNNLVKAEVSLKQAMNKHGVVSVDTEGRAQLETIARLRAQISAKEIALDSLKAFVTPNHSEFRRTQEDLNSLRAELSRLENGNGDSNGSRTSKEPESSSGIQNIQLLRDVKYYETLYGVLAKEYEAARLDEAKNSSVIQVLDTAISPEHRIKPKRALIVVISTFLTVVFSIIFVFVWEQRRKWVRPR
jgi:tyrosine-protein kinase Etk/Wzc